MSRFRMTADPARVATCILAVIALLAPVAVRGQCPPVVGSGKSQPGQSSASGQPEFFDEPQFTVAGVTDTTNLGGHGSDTVLRTKEALAKETASLSKGSSTKTQPFASVAATEKSLRETAEHNPENFEANHRLGKLLVEDGQAREGLPYLERAAGLNPGHYENAYLLARAYADLGKYENARTRVRAVLAQHDKAELHHLLGDVEEKLNHPLEAVREYQRAAELDPSEANLFDWGAELLMHRAAEPAIEVFTKGNRLFPRSVRMLVGLGVAWYTRGSYEQAARHLCEASDLNPSDANPYLFLGKILSVESIQSEGLVDRLGRFVRLQPENALANYYYALSLWKRRKGPEDTENLAQVEALLEKAVHLDPKLGAGYLQLGILYLERGDFPKAISAYQKAIEASPRSAEAHYRLAQAYKRKGESVKAQKELQLYDHISTETAQEVERERREVRQFVYTLRGQTSVSQPR
jgi:tetratricopeptide (TPR) repeat protein